MIEVARTPLLAVGHPRFISQPWRALPPENYQNSQVDAHTQQPWPRKGGPLESLQRLYVCDIANTLGSRPTTDHLRVTPSSEQCNTCQATGGQGAELRKVLHRNKAGALRTR